MNLAVYFDMKYLSRKSKYLILDVKRLKILKNKVLNISDGCVLNITTVGSIVKFFVE